MNTILTYLWSGANLSRREFLPEHVNILHRMAKRHGFTGRFVCITDETSIVFDKDITIMLTPVAALTFGAIGSPEGPRFPSCYRRLWTFSEGAKVLGDNVLLLDIDLVVLKDLTPLFDFAEDFVGWLPIRDWGKHRRLGGGIYLLKPGTRTEVWTEFDGQPSVDWAHAAGFRGSDQAWISYKLAQTAVIFPKEAGIYSIRDLKGLRPRPPKDARLVQFNGPIKPWQSDLPWVRDNWK